MAWVKSTPIITAIADIRIKYSLGFSGNNKIDKRIRESKNTKKICNEGDA